MDKIAYEKLTPNNEKTFSIRVIETDKLVVPDLPRTKKIKSSAPTSEKTSKNYQMIHPSSSAGHNNGSL